jgi:KaiC/GvpD/RAD55 family RecA-like ATPase
MENIAQYDEQAPPLGDDDYHPDSAATLDSKPRRARSRSRRPEPGKASSKNASPIPGLVTPESVMELHRTLSKLPVVASGFHALDEILDGLRPTQPYVLAAATGQGKTSFVLQLITQYQGPVLIWTREMEPWQLQGRMVSQLSNRDSNGILRGEMDDSDYERHMEPFKHRLWYYRDASLERFERSVEHVAHQARDRGLDGPLLVVLDYLQKLAGSTDRLREAVSEASEALRRATQQHRVIAWIVSAVGRTAARRIREQRDLHPRDLVDVCRESGSIEYDAAAILVLGLDPEDENGEQTAVISVATNRFDREGQIAYRFEGASGRFTELGQLEPKAKRDRRDRRDRIIEVVQAASGPLSKNAIGEAVKGRKADINRDIDAMVSDGELVQVKGGYVLGDAQGDDFTDTGHDEHGDDPGVGS